MNQSDFGFSRLADRGNDYNKTSQIAGKLYIVGDGTHTSLFTPVLISISTGRYR